MEENDMGITIKSLLLTTGIILCIPLAAALTLAVYVVKRMRGIHIFGGCHEDVQSSIHQDVTEIIDVKSYAD